MNHKRDALAGWTSALLMFLVAFIIQFAVEILGLAYFGAKMTLQKGHAMSYEEMNQMVNVLLKDNDMLMFFSSLAAAVCALVFGLWYYFGMLSSMRTEERGAVRLRYIPFLFILAICMQCFLSAALSVIEQWQPAWFAEYNELMGSLDIRGSLPAIAYVALVGPVSEELIFRGAIMSKVEERTGFATANIIQAFFFGMYHMNLIQGLYAFVIGLVLGYVCKRCLSVFASISLHIFFNAGSIAILYLGGEEMEISAPVLTAAAMIGLIAMIAMLALINKITKNNISSQKDGLNGGL